MILTLKKAVLYYLYSSYVLMPFRAFDDSDYKPSMVNYVGTDRS